MGAGERPGPRPKARQHRTHHSPARQRPTPSHLNCGTHCTIHCTTCRSLRSVQQKYHEREQVAAEGGCSLPRRLAKKACLQCPCMIGPASPADSDRPHPGRPAERWPRRQRRCFRGASHCFSRGQSGSKEAARRTQSVSPQPCGLSRWFGQKEPHGPWPCVTDNKAAARQRQGSGKKAV